MKLFKKKINITIILKSGKKISFKCDDFNYTKQNNELLGYEIIGNPDILYTRLDEIAAIIKN